MICTLCGGKGQILQFDDKTFHYESVKCTNCRGTGDVNKLSVFVQFKLTHDTLALETNQIRKILRELGIDVDNRTEDEILAVAHTVRLNLFNASQQQKNDSETWLRQRGYNVPKKIAQ